MYIDGIIHHPFVQAVAGDEHPLAAGEVGGIRLGGVVARIVLASQADRETIQGDVLTHLSQEAHTLCIVYRNVVEGRVAVVSHKDARSRTCSRSHGQDGTGHQTRVFPTLGPDLSGSYLLNSFHFDPRITGAVDEASGLFFEGDAGGGCQFPALPLEIEYRIPHFVRHTLRYLVGDFRLSRVVGQHFDLSDMRMGKVDAEILECTVFGMEQRDGQHPSVEDQVRSLSVEGHILPVFEG